MVRTTIKPAIYLSVVEIFFDVLDDDPVVCQLVVEPVHQDPDEALEFGALEGTRLDHGTFLVLLQLILLKRFHFC